MSESSREEHKQGRGPWARSKDTGLKLQVLGFLAVYPWESYSLFLGSVFSIQNGNETDGPTKLLGLLGRSNNIKNHKIECTCTAITEHSSSVQDSTRSSFLISSIFAP